MFFSCQTLPYPFRLVLYPTSCSSLSKAEQNKIVTIKANKHHKMETIMTQKYQNKEHTHKTKMKQNRKLGVHCYWLCTSGNGVCHRL